MSNNLFVRPGFWVKTKEKVKGALDLRKFVRDVLKDIKVPTADSCCPTTTVGAPVRFNIADSKLEYYNAETDTWIQVDADHLLVTP